MLKVNNYKQKSLNSLAKEYYSIIEGNLIDRIIKNKNPFRDYKKPICSYLTEHNYSNVKKIICGNTKELENIVKYFDKEVSNGTYEGFYKFTKTNSPTSKRLGSFLLTEIFNYESIFNKNSKVKDFINDKYEMNACFYCNRQFINIVKIEKDNTFKKALTFDHFYPQVYYPYLALSFYNLIPCCHTCNSIMKGAKHFTLGTNIHPYRQSFDDFLKFKISRFDTKSIIDMNDNNFEIKLKRRDGVILKPDLDRAENNKKVFMLEEVYKFHKDYAKEIEIKKLIYQNESVESLYNKYKSKLFISSLDEFTRAIYGNYYSKEDINRRPLSKLTKDILEDD